VDAIDGEASPIEVSRCVFCERDYREADFFIVAAEPDQGICDECVGYVMAVIAIDDRARFENYVEQARMYAENNDMMRTMRRARS
jgi:hypothetical protein